MEYTEPTNNIQLPIWCFVPMRANVILLALIIALKRFIDGAKV